jgi:hypothetical protein
MSQHNALSQHIIELGNTCLNFTNIIEKKKDSSTKLIEDGKIPRSLCLKCDLTTLPAYENNPSLILLKKELHEATSQFTAKGLEIMKKWSIINIQLLIKDKCNNVMLRRTVNFAHRCGSCNGRMHAVCSKTDADHVMTCYTCLDYSARKPETVKKTKGVAKVQKKTVDGEEPWCQKNCH